MEWVIIWAIVIAAAVLIELESFSLTTAWFAGGGLIAITLAMIDAFTDANISWMWQVIAFVIVSLGLLVGLRPFAKKLLRTPDVPTNADMYFGKKFKLLKDTVGGRSSVSINDVVWTVQVDGDYKTGDLVILKQISGNKYIAEGVKVAEPTKVAETVQVDEKPVEAKTKKAKEDKKK